MIRADELYHYMKKEAKSRDITPDVTAKRDAEIDSMEVSIDIRSAELERDKLGMERLKYENEKVNTDALIPRDVQIRREAERENENTQMRISGISDVLEATSKALDLTEIMKIVNDSSAGEDMKMAVIYGVKRKINFHACLQNSAFRLQFAKLCVREVS